MIASHPPARTSIVRSMLLFAPFLALALAVLAVLAGDAADGGGGAFVGLTLIGLVALLLIYQVVQSLRDLLAQPVETEGRVERRWNRNEFFLFRNSYAFVGGNVFRLSPEQEVHVDLGDKVRIRHYPHTATVEAIEVLERGAGKGAGDV